MNKMYFSILGAVAFLAGCKETSFALCTLINEQELCVKEENQSLKLTGITADHAEWVNKMESMLLSTTPRLEGKKP